MGEKKFDEVKFLAIWLHEAAQKAGQLDTVRRVINVAMTESIEMYGAPSEEEFLEPADLIPGVVSRFSSEWDEHERFVRDNPIT